MKKVKINIENNNILSNRLNRLFDKLINNEIVECIYLSYFEPFYLINGSFIGIELIFNDEDYYNEKSESIVTFAEMYTTAISRILYRKGLNISFNIHSSRRSKYLEERSNELNILYRSEIIFDRYNIYNKIKNNYNKIVNEFDNSIEFDPPLKLKKI